MSKYRIYHYAGVYYPQKKKFGVWWDIIDDSIEYKGIQIKHGNRIWFISEFLAAEYIKKREEADFKAKKKYSVFSKLFQYPKYRMVETIYTNGSGFEIEQKNNIYSKWNRFPFSFSSKKEEALDYFKDYFKAEIEKIKC
jgi:hypothetical protein